MHAKLLTEILSEQMKMADIRSLQGEIQVQNEKLVQKNQEIASKDQELVEQRGKIQQLQEVKAAVLYVTN